MDITYLGHSSFKIKGKASALVTDPFDSSMVGIKFPKVDADLVTVSHDHKDHNMASLVSDVKKIIDKPGEYEIAGTSIIGISSFHDDKKGEIRGKNIIYVIEMDGLRLCHLGDLGHTLTEETISAIGDIDILFVPVGGEFTIDYKVASDVVNAIEPHIIIPMHYYSEDLNQDTFSALGKIDPFLTQMALRVERLPKLSIKAGEISPEDEYIVVLERK